MSATNQPYQVVEVMEKVAAGRPINYLAYVSIGAYMKQKLFWVTGYNKPETVKARAEKWAEEQRTELLATYHNAIRRAAEIREAQRTTEEIENEQKRLLSLERIERGTKCVRHAVSIYGKGREGYWTGYVNVYGNRTDGDL